MLSLFILAYNSGNNPTRWVHISIPLFHTLVEEKEAQGLVSDSFFVAEPQISWMVYERDREPAAVGACDLVIDKHTSRHQSYPHCSSPLVELITEGWWMRL